MQNPFASQIAQLEGHGLTQLLVIEMTYPELHVRHEVLVQLTQFEFGQVKHVLPVEYIPVGHEFVHEPRYMKYPVIQLEQVVLVHTAHGEVHDWQDPVVVR